MVAKPIAPNSLQHVRNTTWLKHIGRANPPGFASTTDLVVKDQHVICPVLSIFPDHRKMLRACVDQYFEVFLDVRLDTVV